MRNEPQPRSQRFAKLLDYQGRQALVFLQRDNTEKLNVIVQVWSDAHDAQIRALVDVETDDLAEVAFDSFDNASLAQFIEASGLAAALNQ
jgi:hypothetical protein